MVSTTLHLLRDAISNHIKENPGLSLDALSRTINTQLHEFAEAGELLLGQDKDLTSESLEIRVYLLLKDAGFSVVHGRPGLEDFIVQAPSGAATSNPLVLEVKSDRKPFVQRDHLRQLDDWVFDLSKEDLARKHGLGGEVDPLAIASLGLISRRRHHPSPHKGVLVFNGPISQPFCERVSSSLSHDERTFAVKRNFCVLPFGLLVDAVAKVRNIKLSTVDFWEKVHSTQGEFTL